MILKNIWWIKICNMCWKYYLLWKKKVRKLRKLRRCERNLWNLWKSIPCCFAWPWVLYCIPKPRPPFTNDIVAEIFLIRQLHLLLLSCNVTVLLILADLVQSSALIHGGITLSPGRLTLSPGRLTLPPGRLTLSPGRLTLSPGGLTFIAATVSD